MSWKKTTLLISLGVLLVIGAILDAVFLQDIIVTPGDESDEQDIDPNSLDDRMIWSRRFDMGNHYFSKMMTKQGSQLLLLTNAALGDYLDEDEPSYRLTRIDTDGNEIEHTLFGGEDDHVSDMEVDDSGIHYCGQMEGSQIWKNDPYGEMLWNHTLTDPDEIGIYDVEVLHHFIYAIGVFDIYGDEETIIMKLSMEGDLMWNISYQFENGSRDSYHWETISEVIVTSDGFYLAGYVEAFDGRRERESSFLAFFDRLGNEVWKKEYDNTLKRSDEPNFRFNGMELLNDHIFISGWTDGPIPGYEDIEDDVIFIAKMDLLGNPLWWKVVTRNEKAGIRDMETDGDRLYILLGEFNRMGDGYLHTILSNGTIASEMVIDSGYQDHMDSIVIAGDHIFLSGTSRGDFQGDITDQYLKPFVMKISNL
ncbi:MAG: hypothetical protein ACMUHY_07365 [Thermoplasmatota archaeon]